MKETVTVFEKHTPYPKFSNFRDARNHYVDFILETSWRHMG